MKITIFAESKHSIGSEDLSDQEVLDLADLIDHWALQENIHQRHLAVLHKVQGLLAMRDEDDEIQEAECPRS